MSYDEVERSNYDGRPINYFEFVVGAVIWRYTDSQVAQTFGGNAYEPAIIEAGEIILSSGDDADDLNITIPSAIAFAALYRGAPPSSQVLIRIRRRHLGDSEVRLVWVGVVKSSKRPDLVSVDLVCRVLTADLARPGARLCWGRGCQYALYDRNCKVVPADYGVTTAVADRTEFRLWGNLGIAAPDYFSGGFIEFIHPAGYLERRAVVRNPDDMQLVMMTSNDGIAVGTVITVYPGCDRTSSTCEGKFSNMVNYGGYRHLPTKSPFDGDPVY